MDLQKEMQICSKEFEERWNVFCETHGSSHNKSVAKYFFFSSWQQAKAWVVPGWISVEDGLPKENQFCVTYFAPTESRLSTLAGHCEFGFGLSSFGCRKATHWMPLPDAPQEPANESE